MAVDVSSPNGADVMVYAFNDRSIERLRGVHESTEIARFVQEYLELDLDIITDMLQSE